MDTDHIIIHRANMAVGKQPLDALATIISRGFHNLEFDITVTGSSSFKFSHPSQLHLPQATYRNDSFLLDQLASLDASMLVADIKYPYGELMPMELLRNMFAVFGQRVVFCAAQTQLLTAAHGLGVRTAQFFRAHISPELPFDPEFYIYDEGWEVEERLHKTIVYCQDMGLSKQYLDKGAPYVLLDLPAVSGDRV